MLSFTFGCLKVEYQSDSVSSGLIWEYGQGAGPVQNSKMRVEHEEVCTYNMFKCANTVYQWINIMNKVFMSNY